jgi:hypothetical protein
MVEIGLLVRRNRTGNNDLQNVVLFRPVLIWLVLKRSPISTSPISFQSYFTDYHDESLLKNAVIAKDEQVNSHIKQIDEDIVPVCNHNASVLKLVHNHLLL